MIDTGVLNFHHSTPANNICHRKSPSKLQRDNQRLQQYRTELPKEKTDKTKLPNEKTTVAEKTTRKSVDTLDTKTTHNNFQPAMYDSGLHSSSIGLVLDETTAHSTDETGSQHSSQGSETGADHKTTSICEDIVGHADTQEVTTNIHSTVDQHNNESECDNTPSQEFTDNEPEQETSDYASLSRKFLLRDKIQLRSEKIKRDIGLFVTQQDRNNTTKKLLLDSFGPSPVILAETDDLIVEFNVNTRKIVNFIIKNSEQESRSRYENMRIKHMRDWSDESRMILEDYSSLILDIRTALPLLKWWMRMYLPRPQ